MELPDFMNYSNKFSKRDFVEKIARIAKSAGAKLVYAALILYYTLQSPKVSATNKAMIIGALGYLISPIDVVPDAIKPVSVWQSGSMRMRLRKSTNCLWANLVSRRRTNDSGVSGEGTASFGS